MKPRPANFHAHTQAGMFLIECLVYIAVFGILLGLGTAAFYFCWDHSRALIYATDDIESALHTGERWRADVRGATGKITVEATTKGEVARIPEGGTEIIYRFDNGELRRQAAPSKPAALLLPKVKSSRMQEDLRGTVTAWRWELEISPRREETHLPLLFTFEAVAPAKP